MEIKQEYPHYIQNRPCGEDKYEGKSQERLTQAIARHITTTDDTNNHYRLSRIIGLEGTWGAGKSNVIKQLKKELNSKYYVFEYDAWGHQEDLQRRSFLETLTTELIKENLLVADDKQKISWKEKLNNLLARKVTRINKTIPKFNAGALLTAIFLSITPITTFISERLESAKTIDNIIVLTIIAFSPIIIGLLLWGIFCIRNKEMRHLGYLLQISKDENIETKNYETINEEEPTVAKFKVWMSDISDYIKFNSKPHLIIVFDNMDRLPADKVKELWSSIHTFFSEDGFENIWTIIPFDENHLSSAFGENSKETMELTKYFIEKTFPIVFRVAPPVITDEKKIFDDIFEEAFNKTELLNQNEINRIFRLEKPQATIREIIVFINHLVTLKNIWRDEIDIISMVLFIIKKDELLKNPINQILSGEYLSGNLSKIIKNDEVLQKNISALVYEVSPDEAGQIPLTKFIENCLNLEPGYNINSYSSNRHFLILLNDKIKEADIVNIDKAITALLQLNIGNLDEDSKNVIQGIWNFIAIQKMRASSKKQQFEDTFKEILIRVDKNHQDMVVKHLCHDFQNAEKFNGSDYYNAIKALDDHLTKCKIEANLQLNDIQVEPEVFIDYVYTAKENYKKYKIITEPDKLDTFVSGLMPDNLTHSMPDVINYLSTDNIYKFPKLLEIITKNIEGKNINENNFGGILCLYKIISDKQPLPIQIDPTQRQNLWNIFKTKSDAMGYSDLVAMQLVNGLSINVTENKIEDIANSMNYYINYGELLIKNLTLNIPVLNKILKYMTENQLGNKLSLIDVLPKFDEIRTKIDVTDEIFLNELNRWSKYKGTINKDNIKDVLPVPGFFKHSKTIQNDLTDYLNKTVIETLFIVPPDLLYEGEGDYWMHVLNEFIDTGYIKVLPDNIIECGKRYINDIAAGTKPIPDEGSLSQKIINRLETRQTSALIKDIRDKYCNSEYTITPDVFVYFENWFEQQGDLVGDRANRVVHRIIQPIIKDELCLKIILSKSDYYSMIVNNAGDDATELKEIIQSMLQNENDSMLSSDLKNFADKIGCSKLKMQDDSFDNNEDEKIQDKKKP